MAPIEYSRKYKGYHYTDPDYNMEKLPLSAGEVDTFRLIVDSLKRFRGADVLQQVEGMVNKLDKVVMKEMGQKKKGASAVVDFEKMPSAKGIEHFDTLYNAILKQQTLLISYQGFGKPASEHVFHPYLLKEYKFRWYVLGYSDRRRSKVVLALDRIENIAPKKLRYKPYRGQDIQSYFEHTLGVTINATGVKEIRLWFSVAQGHYLKTQPLHAKQEIVSDDATGLVISVRLIPNYELLQTLLSFGPEVKVLGPAQVRDDLKAMVQKTLDLYK
jgi:predicted DNA-binding transcriptional regulator YafY